MAELKTKQIREHLRHHERTTNCIRKSPPIAPRCTIIRRRNAMRQLENTAAIRAARKQIARALTILQRAGTGCREEKRSSYV